MENVKDIGNLLTILCELNNRLTELALTLQTVELIRDGRPEDRLMYMQELICLRKEQKQKYATLVNTEIPLTSKAE